MKKKQTRKERALRRLAVLGLCLFFLGSRYGLTVRTAVRYGEAYYNTGPTTLIWETAELPFEMDEPTRLCLSVNDRALMFTEAEFSLQNGWTGAFWNVLDCGGEDGAYVGFHSLWGGRTQRSKVWYLFGQVNDSIAMTLRIRMGKRRIVSGMPGFPGDTGNTVWEEVKTLDIPRTQWFHAEGGTYFIQPVLTSDEANYEGRIEAMVELLDGEGRVLSVLEPLKG